MLSLFDSLSPHYRACAVVLDRELRHVLTILKKHQIVLCHRLTCYDTDLWQPNPIRSLAIRLATMPSQA